MILHNYDVKQSQKHFSTKYSARPWTISNCSRKCGIKWLILIIALSSLVKVTCSVKFPGLGGREKHRGGFAVIKPRIDPEDGENEDNEEQRGHEHDDETDQERHKAELMKTVSDEKRLTSELIQRYERIGRVGRPVGHRDDIIYVQFGLSLIHIMEVDEFNQILKLSLWFQIKWTDLVLRWLPATHDNIESITLPSRVIWVPDIKLYNFADERLAEEREVSAVVFANGSIQWDPPAILKSSCSIDTKYFPFDTQRCELKFGSWSYPANKLRIGFISEEAFELGNYIKNNEWDIISNSAENKNAKYKCCAEPFNDITYRLTLKRRTEFYTFILILPCSLLSILTLVIFWVPPESPAKLQLGMSVFLAFFFLLIVLSEIVPRAAPTIPIIGGYFCLNMVMIALSTLLACIVSNMYFRGVRTKRAPKCLRSFIDGRFSHVFGLDTIHLNIPDTPTSSRVESTICEIDVVPVPLHDNGKLSMNDQDLNPDQYKNNTHNNLDQQQQKHQKQQQQKPLRTIDSVAEVDQGYMSPYAILLQEVRAIRHSLDCYELNSRQKDEQNKIIREWQILASITDRVFFVLFLSVFLFAVLQITVL